MAINKITDPSALPTSTDDYVAQNNAINTHTLNTTPPYPVSGSNIVKGSVFNIGGDLFYTDSDTAITGVSSDYVKLTPGATTAVPTYETAANITANVTWNDAYNGYYDSSGNLYIFDEVNAYLAGTISDLYTDYGRQWENHSGQNLKDTADVTFNDLTLTGVLEPTNSPTSGVITSTTVLSRGLYNISFDSIGAGANGAIQHYVSGAWRTIVFINLSTLERQSSGTAVFSDGVNTRVTISGTITAYYTKY